MLSPRLRVLIAAKAEDMSDFKPLYEAPEFDVIGSVSKREELIRAARILQPGVILCNVSVVPIGALEHMTKLVAEYAAVPFVLVGADFRVTVVPDYGVTVSYVDTSDLVSDLQVALRLAASGIGFRSRNIPRHRHSTLIRPGKPTFKDR